MLRAEPRRFLVLFLMFMVSQQELRGQIGVISASVINHVADKGIATTPIIHWYMNAHGTGALNIWVDVDSWDRNLGKIDRESIAALLLPSKG